MVWGGRRLGESLGKPLPTAAAYGESWEVSDHPSHRSALAGVASGGRTLRDLMEQDRGRLLGRGAEGRTFPWLVKFLDARDWLSVQVHPDDGAAERLWPGEGGKTEAWFVLAADPGSKIFAGLKPGVDQARLRQALRTNTAADCLHQFEPRPGDCLFLSAGTVHAVGGGVLIAEVQQTSDATFRLYDWDRRDAQGRRRDLHVEQALACVDWSAGPVTPARAAGYPAGGGAAAGPGAVRQKLAACRFFGLEYVRDDRAFAWDAPGRLQVVVALHGRGALEGDGGLHELAAGNTLVLPAALGPTRCVPAGGPLGLLVATLPDEA
jgi:mannose-6-phosphate isomerase